MTDATAAATADQLVSRRIHLRERQKDTAADDTKG